MTAAWSRRMAWLLVLVFFLQARDAGSRVEYVGGTVAALAGRPEGVIETTDESFLCFRAGQIAFHVAYESINLLEYGQKVDRRYGMAILISPLFLLSKKRKHFLTVGYSDQEGRQQALVFRVAKSDVRALLVSLEARTGRKVVFQDDEARKAGKG